MTISLPNEPNLFLLLRKYSAVFFVNLTFFDPIVMKFLYKQTSINN